MSTQRRTAGVYSSPAPKGPNGERLCYNCHGPMPKDKRKVNCTPKCAQEWRAKTSPSYMRHLIFKRDKGICAKCGTDTVDLQRQFNSIRVGRQLGAHPRGDEDRDRFLKAHGIPWGRVGSDWWDADHITPVIEGGGECGLDNLRTLCIPCHQEATRDLHARLKEKRAADQRARMNALSEKPLHALTTEEVHELKTLRLKFRPSSQAIADSFNLGLFES